MKKDALTKVPKSLLQQLDNHAMQIKDNSAAIYLLLEERAAPVKVKEIQEVLGLGPSSYQSACRALLETTAELYVTQDGIVLKKYATKDQQYWHLAWSLGLFEISGQHLTMDEKLVKSAPQAIQKLLTEGKLKDARRIGELLNKAKQTRVVLANVMNMYREIEDILNAASRKQIKSKDWKKGLKQIKKELEE